MTNTTPTPTPTQPSRAAFGLYAVTIFVGAFLLFQVQPLIAKFILPWFGGSPAVWTTCMLFFQVVLVAGYGYAHLALSRMGGRGQAVVHVVLLVAALATLPIIPGERWKPVAAGDPTWRICGLLMASVGLPYLLLAATGPLLQGWLGRVAPGWSPYRLYALSNLASLGALLTYPVWVEPTLSRRGQAVGWSVGFGVFALLSAGCAVLAGRGGTRPASGPAKRDGGETESGSGAGSTVSRFDRVMWLLLPACGTLLLLATTNKICQEVAVIPFLWVGPLAIYLLTFVIAFDRPRWYHRGVMMVLLPAAVGAVAWVMVRAGSLSLGVQLGTYAVGLFVACMVCHGELARLRPPAGRLTAYYLTLSAGGAVGGLFVAIVAPLVFKTYFEFPLSVIVVGVLAMVVLYMDRTSRLHGGRPNWAWVLLIAVWMLLGYAVLDAHVGEPGRVVAAARSFYGVLSVVEPGENQANAGALLLRHGGVTHGLQLPGGERRREPTTYYGHKSGVGVLLDHFMTDRPRRVGVVGLGAGTLAAYGRAGDTFRFYEINPQVLAFAEGYFTFLKDSAAGGARVEHVLGDARLSLQREADQHFDVLVLDAFNGDAIPTHLLTREAFDLYRRHLNPGGVIAVHISNQHLDLRPIVRGAAGHLGLGTLLVEDAQFRPNSPVSASTWMLVGADREFLAGLPIQAIAGAPEKIGPRLWTDDDSSLVPILK